MGSLIGQIGTRPYFDVNLWIYFVEQQGNYLATLDALFVAMERGDFTVLTSEISLAEALVNPIQLGQVELALSYKRLFRTSKFQVVAPVDTAVLIRAAELRAAAKLKLPDAVHAATAELHRCTAFVTNDSRLAGRSATPVVTLPTITI